MTTSPIEAVVAGSRGFALALLAPLTERVGTRPRVATDPAQALALCRAPGGLVVVEFLGEDSLRAIKDLVLQGPALRIVAAVPEAHAAAEAPLRALGVELARWDGKPEGVLGAVSRQIAGSARAAESAGEANPTPPRPAAAPSSAPSRTAAAPSAPPGTAAAAAPAPVAPRSPAPAPPRPNPALAQPGRAAPNGPAGAIVPPSRPVASAPAVSATRAPAGAASASAHTAAPSIMPPSRPGASAPAAPAPRAPAGAASAANTAEPSNMPPARAVASAPAVPAMRAPPGDASAPAHAPAPAMPPQAHASSSPSPAVAGPPVLAAAGASIAPAPSSAGAARSGSVTPAAPGAPAGASAPASAGLFDDVPGADDDFDLDVSDGLAAPAPLDEAPAGAWPANVPGGIEAAGALGRGLAGLFDPPGTPLAAVADVVGTLSELERAVLEGAPQPIDPEPVRRAAVMRVRVAAALATAPGEGGAVDAGAVSAFLAEIDALLSDVSTLAASAPPEIQPSLEAVRNSLVKEAIDFSEASHRGRSLEQVAAADAAAARASARAAQQTRIVAVASQAETDLEQAEGKRRRSMVVVLAVSLLVAAAFHGYSFWSSRSAEPPLGVGPLSNAVASEAPGGGKVVHSPGGAPFDPEQLKRLVDEEGLKGNTVRELAPGVVMIVPGVAGGETAAPALAPPAER